MKNQEQQHINLPISKPYQNLRQLNHIIKSDDKYLDKISRLDYDKRYGDSCLDFKCQFTENNNFKVVILVN